jgi:hypothetical protein
LFCDVVGCEDLIEQLQDYQTTAASAKALGMDPRDQLPFNFLFKGPPGRVDAFIKLDCANKCTGTGKTTTAQKMGKVFYDMGLLSQAKVQECSATDMIGQYVGQTGPKLQKLLEKALGKVLFIDEAYRLAGGGFATEAMDELVDCLTKPKFANTLVTILAGYDKDIDRLMSINPGLTSRFPDSVIFKQLGPETSLELLIKVLERRNAPIDSSVLTPPPTAQLHGRIVALFSQLSAQDSWGNARDVKTMAKTMFNTLLSTAVPPVTNLILSEAIILDTIKSMLDERERRSAAVGTSRSLNSLLRDLAAHSQQQQHQPRSSEALAPEIATKAKPQTPQAPPAVEAVPEHKDQEQRPEAAKNTDTTAGAQDPIHSIFKAKRDPGVSDAVWEQLERDKHAMVANEREYRRLYEEKRQEKQRIEELKRAEQAAKDEEERRIREQERIVSREREQENHDVD